MIDEIKKIMILKLTNVQFQRELVARLNSNIDVPFISEKTEGKILGALVGEVCELIEEQINQD